MKKTDIAHLAFRILAIFIFFRALQHISQIGFYLQGNYDPIMGTQMFIVLLIPFLILAAFSALLWIYAERLAKHIFPGDEEVDEKAFMVNREGIYMIAFSIVGVVILAVSIPGIFQAISTFLMFNVYINQPMSNIQTMPLLVEKIAQFAIGFALIISRRGLSRILSKQGEL